MSLLDITTKTHVMKKLLFVLAIITAGVVQAQAVREINDPSQIKLKVDARVEIIYSTQDKVMFNKTDDQLTNIKVKQNGNSLSIMQMGGEEMEDLKIRIYTSKLAGVMAAGGAQVYVEKFPSQKGFIAQATGSSMIDTGDMKINMITIMRDGDSKVMSRKAGDKKETVDGVVVAMN